MDYHGQKPEEKWAFFSAGKISAFYPHVCFVTCEIWTALWEGTRVFTGFTWVEGGREKDGG